MPDRGPPRRQYRIGIDVGGTFTKAVLIDNDTYEVVGRYSVLTTHADPRGVAAGVVAVFRQVLEQSRVDPGEVTFLAHSTTQATNALLEGDVAAVGVIGMAGRLEALLARAQSNIKEIELGAGQKLRPSIGSCEPRSSARAPLRAHRRAQASRGPGRRSELRLRGGRQ